MIHRTLLLTALATLALAAPASAASLVNASGTLTYTGTDAVNDITFTRTAPNTVQVVRDTADDTDAITDGTGCTANTAGADYTCAGVTRVVAICNGGDDELTAGTLTDIPVTLTGGAGDDDLEAGDVDDTLDGGDGDDELAGGAGVDTFDGGAGIDFVSAGVGNDVVRGGEGADSVLGDIGDDDIDGGGGDDVLLGEDGNDRVAGGPGDDRFLGDAGNDDITGGAGYDELSGPVPMGARPDMLVTLDDQPNDRSRGDAGEADNVHADVEAVNAEAESLGGIVPPSANDTFIGNAAANTLSGDRGNDTLEGGANNDALLGGDGDDTIRARDGFADFVNCGAGTDTVEADTLDTLEECETTSVADVGSAIEDRAPTVEITAPSANALLRAGRATTLTANAADDRGIAQVLFLDDDRIVCSDTTAPYTCDFRPRGDDVGRNTLAAVAVDTGQQTAVATRTFRVERFTPTITGRVTPGRDTRAPFTFVTTGRMQLPADVTALAGCGDGVVSIQVKAGGRTLSNRRARLRRDCTFGSNVTFSNRKRFGRTRVLRFTIRFTGNEVLQRSVAVARTVRTRR